MSNNLDSNHVILIGSGPMAVAYAEVLMEKGVNFSVIGRGASSANEFYRNTGIKPYEGGVEKYLLDKSISTDSMVIIATGLESLMISLKVLLNAGIKRILVEKPAAVSIEELLANQKELIKFSDKIFVAYNRRFYSSVIEAKKIIDHDGGLLSMHFEFTEWAHRIEALGKSEQVKKNWFFANSTHVVDLAFYLAGKPVTLQSFSQNRNLKWNSNSIFCGAGVTSDNVLFSYLSNWESAGRWGIELLTHKRRIYLKPLEGIGIQLKDSIAINEHTFDNFLDLKFKPGIYKQIEAFINGEDKKLLNLQEHVVNTIEIYQKILHS